MNIQYNILSYLSYDRTRALAQVFDGWKHLINKFYDELEKHNNCNINDKIFVTEVKQKWGILRIYYTPSHKNIDNIYSIIQKKSLHTCEICGAYGNFIDKEHWSYILCNIHTNINPPDYFI